MPPRKPIGLVLLLALAASVSAQEYPRFTAERKKALTDLLEACRQGGGMEVTVTPDGKKKFWRLIDRKKLRAALEARRGQLGSDLADALLGCWAVVHKESEPLLVAVLEEVGRLRKDGKALGYAAYLSARGALRAGRRNDAVLHYRHAAAQLDRAGAPGWQAVWLHELGDLLRDLRRPDEAAEAFKQAVAVCRRLYPPARFPDGHPELAAALHNAGLALQRLGRAEQATEQYRQAIAMRRKLYPPARHPEGLVELAASLSNLGRALQDQGDYPAAEGAYRETLAIDQKLYPPDKHPNGHANLAISLDHLGSLLGKQGNSQEAERLCRQALAMRQMLYPAARFPDGHPELSTSLLHVGRVLEDKGAFEQAEGHYRKALAMGRRLYPAARFPDGHANLAVALSHLGSVLMRETKEEAEACSRQALAMQRKLYPAARFPDGHPGLATCLCNLADVLRDRGRIAEAVELYRQALAMNQTLFPRSRYPVHPAIAAVQNQLGRALAEMGEYRAAIKSHVQALTMREVLYPPARFPDGHADLAASLSNVAVLLAEVGVLDEAVRHLERALRMDRKLYPASRYPDGHPELATGLNNLGGLYHDRGKLAEASRAFRESYAMRQKHYPPDRYPLGHPNLALCLCNLAGVLRDQGDREGARRLYDQAVQGQRLAQAAVALDRGTAAAGSLKPQPLTGIILTNRADLFERALPERPSADALRQAEQAFALAAALRDRLRGQALRHEADKLRQGERVDYLVSRRLGLLARLFEQEQKAETLRDAFAAIEQGRARVFLESLGEAHAAALAGLPANLAAEERRLSLALRQVDARLQRLSLLPGDEPARQVGQLYADRLKLEDQEKTFLDRLRQSHPQYAGFRHPQPCSVEEARSCLGDNEVALLFAVGTDFSYALLLEKVPRPGDPGQGIRLVRLPGGKDLNPLLGTLLTPDTLQHPARARELAAELHHKLLGPFQERLKGKDLLLVPDRALALLPFEMLVEGQTDDDEGHWLIEQHRVRYAPSLSALHLSRQVKRQKPTQPLWALADPLFGDKFRRLANSAREVESICQALGVPAEKIVRGARANEAAVKAARDELAQARFVHFATHGIVSDRSAYETALVLNQVGNDGKEELGGVNDGFLRLPEVTFLKLNADVVVLSACETARGRRSGGEGISGLARTFLYAGSKGVVCSLWSVDDSRTADLMADFYKHLKAGKDTTDALRQAQLVMARKGLAPFFWAPFVLMGQ